MIGKSTAMFGLAMAAIVTVAVSAPAATISWTSATFVNDDAPANPGLKNYMGTGEFDTSGTLITAVNAGVAAVGTTTYDGITYDNGTISFGSNAPDAYHENNANTDVSRSGTYDTSGPGIVTLGVGGVGTLVIGTTYRVQVLVMDGRAGFNGYHVEFDGIDQGVYGNGIINVTWGDALLVTGLFVADSVTQTFSVEVFTPGDVSNGGQLNALLLHAIPTPAAMPAGLALLGLSAGRRRRRR